MAKSELKHSSAYAGSAIILTTKHAKSMAIAAAFWDKLEANVLEYVADTDKLGTFSGEVERQESALECARRKCEWALDRFAKKVDFALASEGSFGPHPFIPFLPCNSEILYFIDRKRDFHLHLSHFSNHTNYQMQEIQSFEELESFADKAQFPSHALIIRPDSKKVPAPIFKGINTLSMLKKAYTQSMKLSVGGTIWVETDMRAHLNPSRMMVISELAEKLADRLASICPKCDTPGWGRVRVERGLECGECGLETELVKSEIFGCTKCHYEEIRSPSHGLNNAEPSNCAYCNP